MHFADPLPKFFRDQKVQNGLDIRVKRRCHVNRRKLLETSMQ